MTDHAAEIRALKARFVAAAAAQGLGVTEWGYDPDVGADCIRAVLIADGEVLAAPVDQVAIDAAFDDVLKSDRAAADDAAAAEVVADLRRRLDGGGPLLPD